MPLHMDLHKGVKGLTMKEMGNNHLMDLKVQDQYGDKYHKFWMNEESGIVFCLIEGPDKEACKAVHVHSLGNVVVRSLRFNRKM